MSETRIKTCVTVNGQSVEREIPAASIWWISCVKTSA